MKKICIVEGCEKHSRSNGFCMAHLCRWRRYGDPTKGRTAVGLTEKWINEHLNYNGDDCLIWPFNRLPTGYALTWHKRKSTYVYRIMCEHRNGPPPTAKHQAAHSCGNGAGGCVNPNHVSWKTCSENHADKIAHGTYQYGERNPIAKLTARDVLAIRSAIGMRKEIASRFGVSPSNITLVKARKTWAWLSDATLG